MKMLLAIAAVAVSPGLFVCATSSLAAPVTRHTVVEYSDLNLSREPGAKALISRIEHAASRVCGGAPDINDHDAWAAYRACMDDAMNKALADIDEPMVDSLYGRQRRSAGS